MHGARTHARLLDLLHHPLTDLAVGAIFVVGQTVQDRAQLARAVATLLAGEPALDHLHLGTVRHGHGDALLNRGGDCRKARPASISAERQAPAAVAVRPVLLLTSTRLV